MQRQHHLSRYSGGLLCLLALALIGCGGGGGSATPAQTTPVKFDIAWADRSRAINAPASALSAVLTLKQANSDGTDFTYTTNRNVAPAGYTQNVNTGAQVAKVGTWAMTLRFYAQANGAGAVVGTASAMPALQTDGTGIGTVATTGTIASVAVPPNQGILVGAPTDLAFTALDANNANVAVTPGSAFFTVTNGGDKLHITGGQAQGVGNGLATVTVTVDGKTSAPQNINVVAVPAGLETVGLAARYGTVRVRVKGVVDASQTVSVLVGSSASPAASIAYTDANAPAASAANGGAIDFRVPFGLASGNQSVVVTLNGNVLPAVAVKVSDTNPFAVFTLGNGGKFVAELRQDVAPNTVANFVGLATGTKQWTDPCTGQVMTSTPLYDGTLFHRVVPMFVKQGGDPITKCQPPVDPSLYGTGNIGFTIPFENNSLTNEDGALAMARQTDPNSASSQFYIDDGNQFALDAPNNKYAVFGKVVEGLPVAKAIVQGDVLTSVVITGKLDATP